MKASFALRLACGIAGVLLAGGLVSAQMPGSPAPKPTLNQHKQPPIEQAFGLHGEWWNNPRMIERLKLTDDQRKTMDAILQQHREKLIDLHASLEKAEIRMKPLLSVDPPNEAAILAQIDKIAQARAELEKANARFLLAQRAKLTPEQWKIVQDMRMHPRPAEFNRNHGQQPWPRMQGRSGAPAAHAPQPAPVPAPQAPVQ